MLHEIHENCGGAIVQAFEYDYSLQEEVEIFYCGICLNNVDPDTGRTVDWYPSDL